jgi:hypothetical protein
LNASKNKSGQKPIFEYSLSGNYVGLPALTAGFYSSLAAIYFSYVAEGVFFLLLAGIYLFQTYKFWTQGVQKLRSTTNL